MSAGDVEPDGHARCGTCLRQTGQVPARPQPGAAGRGPRRRTPLTPSYATSSAHVRNHDVVLAYAAISSWYAVVPVLVAPLAWRTVDRDWSLCAGVPGARRGARPGGVPGSLLLRSREHDADLRAAWWSERPDVLADLLAAGTATGTAVSARRSAIPHSIVERRWFALHPVAAKRADVVRCPALHSRPSETEFFVVGLLAGACLPLLLDLLTGSGNITSLQADRIARAIVFGLAGSYVAITLTRAAGTGGLANRTPLRLAVAIVGGAATGVLLSLGGTGVPHTETDVVTVALTAVLAGGAVIVLVSELARLPSVSRPGTLRMGAVVLVGAVMAGLASNAALAVSTLTGQRALGVLRQELPFVLTHGGAAPTLGALIVIVATVALASAHALRELRAPLLWGAAVGLLVTAWMIGVRLRVGSLADDEVAWRYYLSCVWLAVAGSARRW